MREYWWVRTNGGASAPLVCDRERHDVDARHHRVARGALREAQDALEELAERLAARRPRGARGEDGEDLVLAEAPLDAGDVGRQAHRAEDEPRRALEQPEQRQEREVDDAERDGGGDERRPLRPLDRDELGHELAEEDVREREDARTRPRRRRRASARPWRARPSTGIVVAVEQARHRRLADPPEAEARERDAELRDREVAVEPADDRLGDDRLPLAFAGARAELVARTLTSANSAATKNPFSAMQSAATTRPHTGDHSYHGSAGTMLGDGSRRSSSFFLALAVAPRRGAPARRARAHCGAAARRRRDRRGHPPRADGARAHLAATREAWLFAARRRRVDARRLHDASRSSCSSSWSASRSTSACSGGAARSALPTGLLGICCRPARRHRARAAPARLGPGRSLPPHALSRSSSASRSPSRRSRSSPRRCSTSASSSPTWASSSWPPR